MMWKGLEKHRDAGLLLLRLGFGIGFMYYHGYSKLIGGPETWENLGGAMSRFGITFWPTFWGFLISFAESIGAVFIAVGFLFQPMCLILGIGMFVAWFGHVVSGNGNPGHPFKNMSVLIGLMFIGPGRFSVDAWLKGRNQTVPDA